MVQTISVEEFLRLSEHLPVLDARAPKEYETGHIPVAQSFPIFSDQERARVGTAYKQQGHDPAVLIGLDLFGPKMSGFVKAATKLAPKKEVLVHCWRGGMRSGAMAWLLNFSGFKTYLLQGGYKAYRQYLHEQINKPRKLIILSGFTGSGKTDILPYLAQQQQQIVDLEGLANHKGSAFGNIGMEAQPTTEHFENLLGTELLKQDETRPIWLEDESITIGKATLPKPFYDHIQQAPTIVLQVPQHLRVTKLAKEYCHTDKAILEAAILKIQKRLGGLATKEALDAIATGDMEKMVSIALTYYDKAYTYDLAKKESMLKLELTSTNPEENAAKVLAFAKKHHLI